MIFLFSNHDTIYSFPFCQGAYLHSYSCNPHFVAAFFSFFFLIFQKAFLRWRCSPCLEHQLLVALWPRVFHIVCISLVNDSELHHQRRSEGSRPCGSGCAHTYTQTTPILTEAMHAPSVCELNPWIYILERGAFWGGGGREGMGEGGRRGSSHLKKPLRIKAGRGGRTGATARQQHGSSDYGWNSNVSSCVAVSSLVFHPLSRSRLTWDANKADSVMCGCSWNYLTWKKKNKNVSTAMALPTLSLVFAF